VGDSLIDWFNNPRIHNEIGKMPPAEFEENYYPQIDTAGLVTLRQPGLYETRGDSR
jgi:hypothetical protein